MVYYMYMPSSKICQVYTLSRPHGFVPYLFFYNDIPLIYYEYLKDIFDAEDAALGQNGEGEAAQPAAAKACGGARKTKPPAAAAAAVPEKGGLGTNPRGEPFVARLFPWHKCHGGAWNKYS